MPNIRKQKAPQEISEGEDFGNDDFSDDSSQPDFDPEPEIIIPEDSWEPIVIKQGAKRDDYVNVSDFLLKINEKCFILSL